MIGDSPGVDEANWCRENPAHRPAYPTWSDGREAGRGQTCARAYRRDCLEALGRFTHGAFGAFGMITAISIRWPDACLRPGTGLGRAGDQREPNAGGTRLLQLLAAVAISFQFIDGLFFISFEPLKRASTARCARLDARSTRRLFDITWIPFYWQIPLALRWPIPSAHAIWRGTVVGFLAPDLVFWHGQRQRKVGLTPGLSDQGHSLPWRGDRRF